VSAPGKTPWQATVVLVEGKTETLRVPALESAPDAAVPVPVPVPVQPLAAKPVQALPRSEPSRENSGLSPRAKVGIGVGAAGAVSLIVGSYFGLRAQSKWSDSKAHCDALGCDQT